MPFYSFRDGHFRYQFGDRFVLDSGWILAQCWVKVASFSFFLHDFGVAVSSIDFAFWGGLMLNECLDLAENCLGKHLVCSCFDWNLQGELG